MQLTPHELPEALQDNPPRPTPNHPEWAISEGALIERAERLKRLRVATIGAALVAALLIVAGGLT